MNLFRKKVLPGAIVFMGLLLGFIQSVVGDEASEPERQLPSEIRDALRGPAELVLESGTRYEGNLIRFRDDTLVISVRLSGGGSADLSFPSEQVARLRFAGSEHRQTLQRWIDDPERMEDAFLLFRAFYNQQARYFSLLQPNERLLFVEYVRFALRHNRPFPAIAMAEAISPYIEDADILSDLDDGILLATLEGGLIDEAYEAATVWTREADPSGRTALGWRVLAQIKFSRENYDGALWAALNPIAFAGFIPMEHLAECYAYAVLSAHELRLRDEAERLHREMRARDLAWPENLADKEPELRTLREARVEEEESAAAEVLEEETPEQKVSPVDPIESLPTRILF